MPRYLPSRRLVGLMERRVLRKLRAAYGLPVANAVARFASQLRDWGGSALGRLAEQFAAQTDPLRAIARRAAEGGGGTDPAAIAEDLAELDKFTANRPEAP